MKLLLLPQRHIRHYSLRNQPLISVNSKKKNSWGVDTPYHQVIHVIGIVVVIGITIDKRGSTSCGSVRRILRVARVPMVSIVSVHRIPTRIQVQSYYRVVMRRVRWGIINSFFTVFVMSRFGCARTVRSIIRPCVPRRTGSGARCLGASSMRAIRMNTNTPQQRPQHRQRCR